MTDDSFEVQSVSVEFVSKHATVTILGTRGEAKYQLVARRIPFDPDDEANELEIREAAVKEAKRLMAAAAYVKAPRGP
ncbi:hypothetical protein ACUN0C_11015 [Faunimonas sp. B44]|uniref:hypothetical protein n=1 Tax=Faunimonas sp. B44 TaxID=3461493 RepID=UPI0040450778